MSTFDLLGTQTSPKPRRLAQWLPWIICVAVVLFVLRSVEEHPECIPHPLSHAHDSVTLSSNREEPISANLHLRHHNKDFVSWNSFESLITFGDSYTTTNFDVDGEQPRPGHPLGNHGSEPLSNILNNWPIFITSRHNASFIKTYSLAVGGSTVDRRQVPPYLMGSTFIEQAKVFLDSYTSTTRKADWNPETSLFTMWFGVNDLVMPHWTGGDQGSMPDIFKSYAETTVKLYNGGARNFLYFTVPPAYRSVDLDPPSLLQVAEDMASWNSRVFEMKSKMETNFPKARFAVFDAHSFWARVIDSPTDFPETAHVSNVTSVCKGVKDGKLKKAKQVCKDGVPLRDHIWTSLHGTFTMHNATAAKIVQDCFGPSGKRGFCF